MCFSKPDIKPAPAPPIREQVTSQEDAVATQLEEEKKRRGFQSTNPTGGSGLSTLAPTAKTQLGS